MTAAHLARPRALVTGHTGFTGRYMVAALEAAGYSVFGLDNGSAGDRVDLADFDAVARLVDRVRPQVVVHLAGQAFVAHDHRAGLYQANLLGTVQLLDALEELPQAPQCVLLASSGNVYGAQAGQLAESVAPQPANDYAVSKWAMERMALLRCDRLPIVIARPFNYTGVGQSEWFVIPKIVGHFQRGQTQIRLGNTRVWRDFGDVRSVVQAYMGLIEACPVGQVVNVCTGRDTALQDVLATLERLSGHHLQVLIDPALIRTNELPRLCGDPALLQTLVPGWQPLPLEDTLRWMWTQAQSVAN